MNALREGAAHVRKRVLLRSRGLMERSPYWWGCAPVIVLGRGFGLMELVFTTYSVRFALRLRGSHPHHGPQVAVRFASSAWNLLPTMRAELGWRVWEDCSTTEADSSRSRRGWRWRWRRGRSPGRRRRPRIVRNPRGGVRRSPCRKDNDSDDQRYEPS